jgi:hypothetical protein
VGYSCEGTGEIVLAGAGVNSRLREYDLLMNDTIAFSPRLLNQFQFFLEKDHNSVRSVTNARRRAGRCAGYREQSQINDILTYSRGRHLFKTGTLITNLRRRAWEDHANRLGTTYYASTAAFAAQTAIASLRKARPFRSPIEATSVSISFARSMEWVTTRDIRAH